MTISSKLAAPVPPSSNSPGFAFAHDSTSFQESNWPSPLTCSMPMSTCARMIGVSSLYESSVRSVSSLVS